MKKSNCPVPSLTVVLIFLVLSVGTSRAEYAPNINPDPIYDKLVRQLVSKYDLSLPSDFSMRPFTASAVVTFMEKADSLREKGLLTQREVFLLQRAKEHYAGKDKLFSRHNQVKQAQTHVGISLIGDIEPAINGSDASFSGKGIIRPEFAASIGDFSFYSQIDVWTEARSDSTFRMSAYQPFEGLSHNLYGRADSSHFRSSDLFRGGVVYKRAFVELSTAVDYIRQGPAVFYPLTFSGNTPPVTYFRASIDFASFKYFQTVGQLRTQKDKSKYLYTHRLQVGVLKDRLTLGINEVIINGSTAEMAQTDSLRPDYYGQTRGVEWVYLIPFVPYSFAEHYVGDRDNAAISFDLSVQLPYAIRCYGEMFLDDISNPVTIFSDDWGNKWAATLGLEHFNTVKGKDIHTIIEYSRIEPWVYTHFYGGSHRYTHYGRGLGSDQGPNSDALLIRAEADIHKRHTVGVQVEQIRKNGSVRGGSIEHVFRDGIDSETKEFLGDGTEKYRNIGFLWAANPYGRVRVNTLLKIDMDGKIALQANGGLYF